MQIDGRRLGTRELFLTLRDAFRQQPGYEISIELLISKDCDFKKLKAFLRMSGCKADMEERGAEKIVRITGGCFDCR